MTRTVNHRRAGVSGLEAFGTECGLERLRVPILAVVRNAAVLDGDEGRVVHVVGIAVADDPTRDAPIRDRDIRIVGGMDAN